MFLNGGPFTNRYWGCQYNSNCVSRFPITRRVYECSSSCSSCCFDDREAGGFESKGNCFGTAEVAGTFCVFEGGDGRVWYIVGGIAGGLLVIGLLLYCCCRGKKESTDGQYRAIS